MSPENMLKNKSSPLAMTINYSAHTLRKFIRLLHAPRGNLRRGCAHGQVTLCRSGE